MRAKRNKRLHNCYHVGEKFSLHGKDGSTWSGKHGKSLTLRWLSKAEIKLKAKFSSELQFQMTTAICSIAIDGDLWLYWISFDNDCKLRVLLRNSSAFILGKCGIDVNSSVHTELVSAGLLLNNVFLCRDEHAVYWYGYVVILATLAAIVCDMIPHILAMFCVF